MRTVALLVAGATLASAVPQTATPKNGTATGASTLFATARCVLRAAAAAAAATTTAAATVAPDVAA